VGLFLVLSEILFSLLKRKIMPKTLGGKCLETGAFLIFSEI
jgi:hypothetical protein